MPTNFVDMYSSILYENAINCNNINKRYLDHNIRATSNDVQPYYVNKWMNNFRMEEYVGTRHTLRSYANYAYVIYIALYHWIYDLSYTIIWYGRPQFSKIGLTYIISKSDLLQYSLHAVIHLRQAPVLCAFKNLDPDKSQTDTDPAPCRLRNR